MKKKYILVLGVGLVVGLWMATGCGPRQAPKDAVETSDIQPAALAEIWTCSMHPQIREPKPGQCPICGMNLIPLAKTDAEPK
jgi:membrane fusion protein, copper/silver efflux system